MNCAKCDNGPLVIKVGLCNVCRDAAIRRAAEKVAQGQFPLAPREVINLHADLIERHIRQELGL